MRPETRNDWLIIVGALVLTLGIVVSMAGSAGALAYLGPYIVDQLQTVAIIVLVFGAVVLVFSAARRTSPRSGLIASP